VGVLAMRVDRGVPRREWGTVEGLEWQLLRLRGRRDLREGERSAVNIRTLEMKARGRCADCEVLRVESPLRGCGESVKMSRQVQETKGVNQGERRVL
jgi:hypothetical protein